MAGAVAVHIFLNFRDDVDARRNGSLDTAPNNFILDKFLLFHLTSNLFSNFVNVYFIKIAFSGFCVTFS